MIARPDRRPPVAIGVLFLAFALAACSSSPAASSASGPTAAPPASSASEPSTAAGSSPADAGTSPGAVKDACTVVTAADVEAAFGVTGVKTLAAAPLEGSSACVYTAADGTSVGGASYIPDGGGIFEAFQGSQGVIQIPGAGDGAYLYGNLLYVKKGIAVLQFTIDSAAFGPDKTLQIFTAIAKAAASRM